MGHNHTHGNTNYNKAFALGIVLNLVFIAVELFYGFVANSSALIADAGHNASDVLGLVFAWFAIWLASQKPKNRYSYGYKKSTILISLLNAVMLFVAMFFIAKDAIDKIQHPEPVGGTQVMIVAGIGVIINTITALLFIKGQKDDLNIRGAFLHMAADAAVSLGVVVGGLLIKTTGALWIDPVMSFLIIVIILWGTWRLFTESLNLALDAVPQNINYKEVEKNLRAINEVTDLHDLHIWAMSTNENSLSVHITTDTTDANMLLLTIKHLLEERFNLHHTTIQIEKQDSKIHCHTC